MSSDADDFRPSLVVWFTIKLGGQVVWTRPEEVISRDDFFKEAADALRDFKQTRPDISLLEAGLTLDFALSVDDGGAAKKLI